MCLLQKQHISLLREDISEIKALFSPSLPTINVQIPYLEAPLERGQTRETDKLEQEETTV